MHETFVAKRLVDLVLDEIGARGCPDWVRVAAVRVRLGRLNSVVPAALRSAFDVARRHTPLHEARLEIDFVEPRVWCDHCEQERDPIEPPRLRCPICNGRCPKLLRGLELEMAGIELAQEPQSP